MAYPWTTFIDEVTARIDAIWTDVGNDTNGIFEYDEAVRETWERRTFPIAIYRIFSVESADWGLNPIAYEVEFEITYIQYENVPGSKTMATVRDKLEALKLDLVNTVWTDSCGATLLDVVDLNWSDSHPLNQIFYQRNLPYMAGSLTAHFVLGETTV